MARYRLAAPHFITNRLGTAMYLEAGTVIDSAEMPSNWIPTPAMQPLDSEAAVAHSEVMQNAIAENGPHISGLGHVRDLPRGAEHLRAAEKKR